MKTEELDRLYKDSKKRDIGFQLVNFVCGNSVFNGQIESVLSIGAFVYRFDDNDVKTYS